MRRVLLSFIIGIAFLCNTASAQLEVVFTGPPTVTPNGQVSVDVAVNNFSNIISAQFSINWDSLVLNYNSITNITPLFSPPVTQAGNIGTPDQGGAISPGEATYSWSYPSTDPETIPNGSVLFTIVFDAVGPACSNTGLTISGEPRAIEVIVDDGNFTDIGAVSGGANIEVDCDMMMECGPNNGNPNCGSGDTNGLGLIGSDGLVQSGEVYCMELTVQDFNDIQSFGFNVNWDPSLLQFVNTQNYCDDLIGLGASSYNLSSPGTLISAWFDGTGSNPVDLPDGKVITEICFTAVGPNGSYADISFSGVEFGDSNQDIVPSYTDCGSVEICEIVEEPGSIDVTIPDVVFMGSTGDEVCVDIVVDGFTDVASFQFALLYDSNFLMYTGATNVNGLINPDPLFNEDPAGTITLNWFESMGNGIDLPDGSTLFSLCFDVVNGCDNDANISFFSGFDVEFANSDDEVIEPVNTSGGTVSIDCPDGCMCTLNVIQPDCGGGVGSITIDMGDCEMPIESCEWTFDGNPVNVGGCSLFAAQEGLWAVTVTAANGATCSRSATIQGPDPITFGSDIVDVSCDGLGSITVNNIVGGSGGYTFKWSNGATTQTIDNLPAASYTVTVCDVNSCSSNPVTYMVDNVIQPIAAVITSTDDGCLEDDGSAVATVSGGCTPYSSETGTVAGNMVNYTGLAAGDYTDVITDVNGSSVTVSWTINAVVPMAASPVIINSNGDDGKITFNTTGGDMNYTYEWSPMDGNIAGDALCDLPPSTYMVTITDGRGCELILSDQFVDEIDTTSIDSLTILSFSVASEGINNGSGVSCNGVCDGSLEAVFEDAMGDVTILLSNDSGMTWDNLDADDLCPGTYTLTATDTSGTMATATAVITEPEQISIDIDTMCVMPGNMDGAIDITVTGGTGDYTYIWTGGAMTEDLEDLTPGTYTVVVSDANGCSNMVPVDINCETVVSPPCFEFNNIITPSNPDGFNDVLEISCADTSENTLTIFDRWGREVFGAVNYQNNWNGTTDGGDELGEGTYFHVLEVMFPNGERRIYKGSVTILRGL